MTLPRSLDHSGVELAAARKREQDEAKLNDPSLHVLFKAVYHKLRLGRPITDLLSEPDYLRSIGTPNVCC